MITKAVYPAIFTPCAEGGYFVQIPDLQLLTQGDDMCDAIAMARDAIKLKILTLEEHNEAIPYAGSVILEAGEGAFLSYVDIDMQGYREKYGSRSVKKNCTLPQWLCSLAEEQNINFSKVLQEALLAKLSVPYANPLSHQPVSLVREEDGSSKYGK